LVRIRDLFVKRGNLSASELARELGYSPRTIQRDLLALDTELNVPLIYENRRWRIMEGANMVFGPVRLTLHEARAVYFATRLMLRSADERDPDGIAALEKIAEALPGGVASHMQRTVTEYSALPANMQYIQVVRRLTEAWASNHTATITYRSATAAGPRTTDLDPYLLDHTQSGTYVAGFSSEHGQVRIFKVDRISDVEVTAREFDPGNVAEVAERLRSSWGGVVFGEAHYDVTIDFASGVANRVRESYWHPSQSLESLPGGGVRLRVSLPSLLEITPWVLGWGASATVIEPPELRDSIATALRDAAANYN
jgi:predicted DNA-binding transcriptional regulator YafY